MQMRNFGIAAGVAVLAAWSGSAAAPYAKVQYTAQMSGAMETPPNTSKGTGTATLTIVGNELHYMITVQKLSGPATMAHIHIGKAGASGPPAMSFTIMHVADGTLADDSVDLTKDLGHGVSADSLKVLLDNGGAYINVHTAANPGGEIRGQFAKR